MLGILEKKYENKNNKIVKFVDNYAEFILFVEYYYDRSPNEVIPLIHIDDFDQHEYNTKNINDNKYNKYNKYIVISSEEKTAWYYENNVVKNTWCIVDVDVDINLNNVVHDDTYYFFSPGTYSNERSIQKNEFLIQNDKLFDFNEMPKDAKIGIVGCDIEKRRKLACHIMNIVKMSDGLSTMFESEKLENTVSKIMDYMRTDEEGIIVIEDIHNNYPFSDQLSSILFQSLLHNKMIICLFDELDAMIHDIVCPMDHIIFMPEMSIDELLIIYQKFILKNHDDIFPHFIDFKKFYDHHTINSNFIVFKKY